MSREERLCIALDLGSRDEILAAARRFAWKVGWLKIGLEAFISYGPQIVGEVAQTGARVFLDLKLHDIPSTVARSVAAASRSGASMINVHALGGREMLVAAREAAAGPNAPKLIAVTLLTSLDAQALADLPVAGHAEGITRRLAMLSKECGLDGVVCSPRELGAVKGACGSRFLTVVPGIRSVGSERFDQRRIATPSSALAAGADLLVVGRPITAAADPDAALESVLAEIRSTS